jgi:hypothetical protein
MTTEIPRDRYGRPLIVPPDGGKPVPYMRVSTFAKMLDDSSGLTRWKMGQVAKGLGIRPDLAALAKPGIVDKDSLRKIVDEALVASESDAAANLGTAIHSWTELADNGDDLADCPEHIRPDVNAYLAAMNAHRLSVSSIERFVVVDEWEVAGTFDRLVTLPDGRMMVADIKTGADAPRYSGSIAIQCAAYAAGQFYDAELHRMDMLPLPEIGVDQNHGLLIHIPAGTGTCTLHTLDLAAGRAAAELAIRVRGYRSYRHFSAPLPNPEQDQA